MIAQHHSGDGGQGKQQRKRRDERVVPSARSTPKPAHLTNKSAAVPSGGGVAPRKRAVELRRPRWWPRFRWKLPRVRASP